MELYPTVSAVAFSQRVALWLLCPAIFGESLHRARADRQFCPGPEYCAQGQAWLAGLRDLGKNGKGIGLDLKAQAKFQQTQA